MSDAPQDQCNDASGRIVELRTASVALLESRAAIAQDLLFVVNACTILLEHLNEEVGASPEAQLRHATVLDSFWTAIVIAFERCFSSGKRVAIQREEVDNLDPSGETWKLYRHYAGMRDKHLAHSVNPFATVKVGAELEPRAGGDRGRVARIVVLHERHTSGKSAEVEQLRGLAARLHDFVAKQCNHLVEVQVLAEARQVKVDDLYVCDHLGIKTPGPEDVWRPRQ